MTSPTRGSPWASTGGSHQQVQEGKPSPAKAVAGALKRLFRLSSDKGDEVPSPMPTSPKSGSPTVRSKVPLDHPKPGSFKQHSSMEPPSVLDYDDRFSMATDRTSAITQTDRASTLTDRQSILSAHTSDRASALVMDRSSVLTSGERSSALTDRPSVASQLATQPSAERTSSIGRANSRGSGGSRLGSYIRNLIKQPNPPSQPTTARTSSPTAPAASSSPPLSPRSAGRAVPPVDKADTAPAGPSSRPVPVGSSGAPWQTGGPFVLGSSGSPAGPSGQYGSSVGSPFHSASPCGLPECATLPKINDAAKARMARDPGLLTVANDLPSNMDRAVWRLEDFTLLQKLHAGYASAVYKAFCRVSGQTVALKLYQPAKLHEISQWQLYREARLHTLMSHPNIIKLYAAFRNGDTVVLVQEYADGGDLLQLLMQHSTRLSERRATQLVLEPLLRALYYLHSRMIVHRDVKLENILFMGREMTLKLADFGLCLNLREERSVTRAGTLDYMAPEVLKCPQKHKPQDNKERLDLAYNMAVDIWALGVVGYELLNGCPPFTCHDKKETEKRIQSGLMPEFVVEVSDSAREFVYSCLTGDAEQRPTAWALLRQPWIKAGTRTSTSALMETMAARRAAAAAATRGGSSPPLAALADIHMEDSGDEDEEPPYTHEHPSRSSAPTTAYGPVLANSMTPPSPLHFLQGNPFALYAQQSEPLAGRNAGPSATAAAAGPSRGSSVSVPRSSGVIDPSNAVSLPSSVNTGRLNVGNLASLLPSKSGQPLVPTTQLLQQQSPAAGASPASPTGNRPGSAVEPRGPGSAGGTRPSGSPVAGGWTLGTSVTESPSDSAGQARGSGSANTRPQGPASHTP